MSSSLRLLRDFWGLARKNHADGRVEELIAGWKTLKQTLGVCLRA
jgi:hypothetical protein